MERTLGPTTSQTLLRRRDGIISNVEFVGFKWMTISVKKDKDTESNWVREAEEAVGSADS